MRLSDYVPRVFFLEGRDAQLYGLILQDYAYFQRADLIEEKISADRVRPLPSSSPTVAARTPPGACADGCALGALARAALPSSECWMYHRLLSAEYRGVRCDCHRRIWLIVTRR